MPDISEPVMRQCILALLVIANDSLRSLSDIDPHAAQMVVGRYDDDLVHGCVDLVPLALAAVPEPWQHMLRDTVALVRGRTS